MVIFPLIQASFKQEKCEKAVASLAQMEKRAVMAETMLEATVQYEHGQVKAVSSPRYIRNSQTVGILFLSVSQFVCINEFMKMFILVAKSMRNFSSCTYW